LIGQINVIHSADASNNFANWVSHNSDSLQLRCMGGDDLKHTIDTFPEQRSYVIHWDRYHSDADFCDTLNQVKTLKPNSRFLVFSRHLPKARPADWIVKQY
jgi:hypothetical protein